MLVETFLATCDAAPDRVAVADHAAELTYGRLARVAAVLRDIVRSQTASDRVGLCLPACAVFPAALFGVLWASKKAVPLNFLLSDEELRDVVKQGEPLELRCAFCAETYRLSTDEVGALIPDA